MSGLTLKSALPCPFCGSTKLALEDIGGASYWFVQCKKCSAEGPHEDDDERETAAVARWNKRANTPDTRSLDEAARR